MCGTQPVWSAAAVFSLYQGKDTIYQDCIERFNTTIADLEPIGSIGMGDYKELMDHQLRGSTNYYNATVLE